MRTWWIVFLMVVIGSVLRGYHVQERSIWFDESFSWRLIQFPTSEMVGRAAQDVHPPLYYIVLKGWATVFGPSILSLRSFSVLCSIVSIVAIYGFTSFAFNSRRAGLIASLLVAVSGWAISYAGEARMYTLGMALSALSSAAVLYAYRRKSLLWFTLYGALAAALALTHYYGMFTILAQVCFVLGALIVETKGRIGELFQERAWWGLLVAIVLMLAIFSPWMPAFFHQVSQVRQAYWVPEVSWRSVPETFYQFFIPSVRIPSGTIATTIALFLPLVVTCAAWATLILLRPRNIKSDGAYLTVLLALVPFLASLIVSFSGRSLYNDRFFAFAGMFVFVALAGCIEYIRHSTSRRIVLVCMLAGIAVSTIRYWQEVDLPHKGGLHSAMQELFTQHTGNEPIIVSSPYIYFPALYYAEEEFQKPGITHLYSPTGELSHFSGAPIAIPQDIVVPEIVAAYKGTVWVLDTTGFTEKPFAPLPSWKKQESTTFPEVFVHQGNITLTRYRVL